MPKDIIIDLIFINYPPPILIYFNQINRDSVNEFPILTILQSHYNTKIIHMVTI